MRYRKKPLVIEAIQMTQERTWDDADWPGWLKVAAQKTSGDEGALWRGSDNSTYIHTLEGDMEVKLGDWIIRDVQGELYPCKPHVFARVYEEV